MAEKREKEQERTERREGEETRNEVEEERAHILTIHVNFTHRFAVGKK